MKKIFFFALPLFVFTVTLVLTLAFFQTSLATKPSITITTNSDASTSATKVNQLSKKTVGQIRELYPDRLGLQLADGKIYFFTFSDDFQVKDNQDLKIDQKAKVIYQGDLTDEKIVTTGVEVLTN